MLEFELDVYDCQGLTINVYATFRLAGKWRSSSKFIDYALPLGDSVAGGAVVRNGIVKDMNSTLEYPSLFITNKGKCYIYFMKL